jgi:hypothetical protein
MITKKELKRRGKIRKEIFEEIRMDVLVSKF